MRLFVEQHRGTALETVHEVSAALWSPSGVTIIGEDRLSTWRSAAKPFQLEVSAADLDVEDEDLALGASSHSAEPGHIARVVDLQRRLGVTVDDLYCGTHWPIHPEAGRDLLRSGEEATPLHNNCSGKHTFMAAASRLNGWPHDYRDPAHPLQQRIKANVEARTGVAVTAVIDGCGVPCWVLPLSGMARAWSQIGDEGLLGRIERSMRQHPWMASGTDRVDGTLMRVATRPLVAKIGAEGILCGALPEEGVGFALKVHSGRSEMRATAACAVLERWCPGLVDPAHFELWTVVRDVAGRPVGHRSPRLQPG